MGTHKYGCMRHDCGRVSWYRKGVLGGAEGGPAHRWDCWLVMDITLAWASCSDPGGSPRRWGEGVNTIPFRHLGPTQAVLRKSPLSFKGTECRSPAILTTTVITVSICSWLCHLLSLFPALFTITYKLGKLLPPGFRRREWMFPEVK